MQKLRDESYKKLFLIAAIYNLWASLCFLLFPHLSAGIVFEAGAMTHYYAQTFYNFTWGFVFIFGVGYYIVSRNVTKNHGIVFMGILGKLFFFLYYLYMYQSSKCTILAIVGVTGDLLFSLLFAYFLYDKRRA